VPDGITFAQIDPRSGLRAVDGGPSRLEVFVRGSEPTQFAQEPEPEEGGVDHAAVQSGTPVTPSGGGAADND